MHRAQRNTQVGDVKDFVGSKTARGWWWLF